MSGEIPYLEINPFGDIRITVNSSEGKCDYRVSSHQIMASSTFFRNLLGSVSQFKEAEEFRKYRGLEPFQVAVTFDDHNLKTCGLMLHLLHGKTPDGAIEEGAGDLEEMFSMAALAVYLDCGEALTMWATMVMPKLVDDENVFDRPVTEMEKWLHVARVFRVAQAFRQLTEFCIKNSSRKSPDQPLKLYRTVIKSDVFLTSIPPKLAGK